MKTPFGNINFLTGQNAISYYDFYKIAEDFSKQRRLQLYQLLFDSDNIIFNKSHQGFVNMNEVVLGAYCFDKENELYPITINEHSPSFIVKSVFNLNKNVCDKLGFTQRAKKLNIEERLMNANILPHGAGYKFPTLIGIEEIFEIEGNRIYKISTTEGIKECSNIRDLPYTYRGQEVIDKVFEYEMVKPFAKLEPLWIYNKNKVI